jgi:hypothetical protein
MTTFIVIVAVVLGLALLSALARPKPITTGNYDNRWACPYCGTISVKNELLQAMSQSNNAFMFGSKPPQCQGCAATLNGQLILDGSYDLTADGHKRGIADSDSSIDLCYPGSWMAGVLARGGSSSASFKAVSPDGRILVELYEFPAASLDLMADTLKNQFVDPRKRGSVLRDETSGPSRRRITAQQDEFDRAGKSMGRSTTDFFLFGRGSGGLSLNFKTTVENYGSAQAEFERIAGSLNYPD